VQVKGECTGPEDGRARLHRDGTNVRLCREADVGNFDRGPPDQPVQPAVVPGGDLACPGPLVTSDRAEPGPWTAPTAQAP
jgi:hypothetical protein